MVFHGLMDHTQLLPGTMATLRMFEVLFFWMRGVLKMDENGALGGYFGCNTRNDM